MNIPLKKPYADWISQQVTSGRYASEAEAVEDAIAAKMKADNKSWQDDGETLRARVRESERQAERGEVIAADDASFDMLRERISTVVSKGKRAIASS